MNPFDFDQNEDNIDDLLDKINIKQNGDSTSINSKNSLVKSIPDE